MQGLRVIEHATELENAKAALRALGRRDARRRGLSGVTEGAK